MVLDVYEDAIEYSAKDWKNLVLLGTIALFGFLLIPIYNWLQLQIQCILGDKLWQVWLMQ